MGNEVPGEAPVSLCPPQTPRGLTCDQIRTAAEGRTRRTGFRPQIYAVEVKGYVQLGCWLSCTEVDESRIVNCGGDARRFVLSTSFSIPYSSLWPAIKPKMLVATQNQQCQPSCEQKGQRLQGLTQSTLEKEVSRLERVRKGLTLA